jgi:hypothetical protein
MHCLGYCYTVIRHDALGDAESDRRGSISPRLDLAPHENTERDKESEAMGR